MKNIEKKTLYKSGISLIVLIITIVVTLILIAATVISTAGAINNARLTTFSKDLTDIQDATEAYYITNNVIPVLDEVAIMNNEDLLAISRDSNILLEEITENNDLNSEFYAIDLAKINVEKAVYGYRKLGPSDIFVISYPAFNVYYPYGIYVNGIAYFSITSKLSNVTKIPLNEVDTSLTSVISSSGIKLTKTSGWANRMGVSLEVDMNVDEVLYMSVSGDVNRVITTIIGKNLFGFDLLSKIVTDEETIKVPTLTLVEANYIESGTKPSQDRYVDILKYKSGEYIGKVRIDLSNFSKTLPTIISATLSSYSSINTVKLLLSSSESGIKEVRYEYLNKYTDNGTIENYYTNVSDFDSIYMQSKAKISTITNDLTTTINAPKNIQSIKVALIDNAGNVSLYNQEIAPRLYIGYSLDIATTTSLQLTAKMFSINGIKSISFSKSLDGINYTDEQVYTLNTTINGVTTKQSLPFTDLFSNYMYIKMISVNYDNTITEIRIIKANLTGSITFAENKPILSSGMTAKKWNGSSWDTISNPDNDTTWYNYTNKQWANAQTADGSMWVWIPRYIYKISSLWHTASTEGGIINVQFSKGTNDNWNSDIIGTINTQVGSNASNNTWTNHPAFTFGSTELTGIWVAKFEASGASNAIDIKPGVSSFRNITISAMFNECRNMETNSRYGWGTSGNGIDTHLIKNVEWGACSYLSQSIYGRDGIEIEKNSSTDYYTGGGTDLAYVSNISQSTTGNITGIYDMSGGSWEYSAAYVNNGNTNLTTYGNSILNAASRYKDVYTVTTDTAAQNYANTLDKRGDAVYETSNITGISRSWFNDDLIMANSSNPFFMRGGVWSSLTQVGIFAFNMHSGRYVIDNSFRPVLVVDVTL